MKYKAYHFIAAVALVLLMASCDKEIASSKDGLSGKIQVSAIFDDGGASKVEGTEITEPDHRIKFQWQVSDAIFGYFGSSGNYVRYTIQSAADINSDGKATFTLVEGKDFQAREGTVFYLVHIPGSNGTNGSAIPVDYGVQSGTFEDAVRHSYWVATGTVTGKSLTLTFKNTMSIVKVTGLKAKGESINDNDASDKNYLSVSANSGMTVSGEIMPVDNEGSGIMSLTNLKKGSIRVNTVADGTAYFAIPSETEITDINFTFHNGNSLSSKKIVGTKAISRNCSYLITIPEDEPLRSSGLFSIGDGRHIRFAQGNVCFVGAEGETGTEITEGEWGFEENQYDFRTHFYKNPVLNIYVSGMQCYNGVLSSSGTPKNNWGLFCWSTDDAEDGNPASGTFGRYYSEYEHMGYTYEHSTTNPKEVRFVDWGSLFEKNEDGTDYWRTLSVSEWQNLLDRTFTQNGQPVLDYNGRPRRMQYRVKVMGIPGVIFFPDDVTWEMVRWIYEIPTLKYLDINDSQRYLTELQSYFTDLSAEQWNEMEALGCAFLPCAAWYNSGGIVNRTSLSQENPALTSEWYYWTSDIEYSPNINESELKSWYGKHVYCTAGGGNYYPMISFVSTSQVVRHINNGYAVRLVHDEEP